MFIHTDENKISIRSSGQCRLPRRQGYTLIEMVVAIAAGLMILGAFIAITLNVNIMMIFTGNYNELDEYSRNTLDMLSRDIRNATSINTSSTSTNLMLINTFYGTNETISYTWDGSNDVRRAVGNQSQIVLKNCNYLAFDYFMRVPTNGLTFIDITNALTASEAKLVSVSWRCSRSVMGEKLNTESVQTAQVAMRN